MAGSCDTHGSYSGSCCTFCIKVDKPIKKSCSTKHRRDGRGSDTSTMSQDKWCQVHQVSYSGTCCTFCIDASDRFDDLGRLGSADGLISAEKQADCDGLHHPSMMN